MTTGVHFDAAAIAKLRPELQAQIADEIRSSVSAGQQKQDRRPALGQAPKIPRFHSPVYIRIIGVVSDERLDPDNFESKAIIDGLVANRILQADRLQYLPHVQRHGFPCETKEEEKTIIELWDRYPPEPEHP